MAEKVGALAYDLVMNTVRFEKGAAKTRSSLKTLNQNFKKAASPVAEYEQRMRDLTVALNDGQISPKKFAVFQKQEIESLKQKGFLLDKNGKATKTEAKLLQDQIDEQKKLNELKRLETKLEQEKSFSQKADFVKRRNRGAKEHEEVMRRLHSRRLFNKKSHQAFMINMRERIRLQAQMIAGGSAGRAAAIGGNLAGFLGASGAQIGGVRALIQGGKGLAPIFAAGGMALIAGKAVKAADQLKRITIDLGVLMGGSAAEADKLVKGFQNLARVTPLSTKQLAEGARQLMSFGRSAGKVTKDLEIIGIIAGGDTERFRLLTKAFADVTAIGKLQGQELRQLANQGFNPLMAMAESTGQSYKNLRIEMEKGNITAKMVFDSAAFKSGEFADRLEKSMNTISGQAAKLGGLLQELLAKIGSDSGAYAAALSALKGLNFVLERMIGNIRDLQEGAEKLAVALTFGYSDFLDRLKNLDFSDGKEFFENVRKSVNLLDSTEQKRAEEAKSEEIRKEQELGTGPIEEYQLLFKEQEVLIENLAKATQARIQHSRDLLNVTEDDVKLQKLKTLLANAELNEQSQRVQLLKESISLQKELMRKKKEVERSKRVLEMELDVINEEYDLEEKRIAEVAKLKTDAVNEAFNLKKKLATMERNAGGPSEDFTAAGADYRFVQQRRNELNAARIELEANKERKTQLDEIKEILLRESQKNEEWRANHPRNQPKAI